MLSDLLTNYARHYAAWARQGGVRMDGRVCALMHANLLDAAEQARRLEGAPVPPASAGALPPGVVSLDAARLARGGR